MNFGRGKERLKRDRIENSDTRREGSLLHSSIYLVHRREGEPKARKGVEISKKSTRKPFRKGRNVFAIFEGEKSRS